MFGKFAKSLAVAAALSLSAGAVLASENGKVPEETAAQIKATLTEQGYEVRKIKSEDGMYEAYALKDGKKVEVYLDKGLKVVRTKIED